MNKQPTPSILPLCSLLMAAVILASASASQAAKAMIWQFAEPREIADKANIEPGRIEGGCVSGEVRWDPHVSLRVPPEGLDAAQLTWLEVRLYSSQEADVLDVYYQSPDGRWCLGGKLPIQRGWAVYRMDLTKNHWRETQTDEASRQWGGPTKRASMLRIDPGNQADRWIALDYVKLQPAEAGLKEGVVAEPRGTARVTALKIPASVRAGEHLTVSARLTADVPPGLSSGTALIVLRRDAAILRQVEQKIDLSGSKVDIQAELPISRYWYPGPATVEILCYELDVALNGVPRPKPVEITSDRVDSPRPPVVELRPLGGDPAIFVDGQPAPGYAYVAGGLQLEDHRKIATSGIHLYCDWFGTSNISDLGHIAPDRYDYAEFDRYFAAILDADPDARFIPHIGLTGPQWWQEAHPDEMCKFDDGTRGPTSFASEVWKREIGEDLRRLIAYLRRAPYADRILGYMFYNGATAEWQMWGTWREAHCDYSEPALRAFRTFLRHRYPTDQELQRAWGDPAVTFDTAQMPDAQRRRPGGPRVLRDPRTERQAVDFYQFINEMDADAIVHFARIVREATEGKSLVGTYYAYLTAHGINQQDSGHSAARRVFDAPEIDFLMSPPNYWYRNPGEACTFMSATDSFRLRGKLWLDESDHRTHLTEPSAGYGRANNLEETLGVYWRELAEVLAKRAGVSWFDMGGGWFSDPAILGAMGRGHEIAKEHLAARKPFTAEIGVFVDPESFYWMRLTPATPALVLHQVTTMPQSGAPWDFLLLDDIAQSWVPDYKLYVFLNAFYVDPAKREAIHAKLKRNGATALFVYAPGYLDAAGESLENMRLLTGITLAKDDREGRPQIIPETADPLARGLAADAVLGTNRTTVAPLFYADDPGARVAGRLVETKQPGLVVKPMDGWTSVYSAAMELPPALMRNIARSAGVHVWVESDDALYTDAQILGLHAATDGRKEIHLPQLHRVSDAVTGAAVECKGTTLTVPLKKAQTVLLRLEPLGAPAGGSR